MKPLETNQRVLTWLCGYPPNESTGKSKRIAYIVFTVNVIIAMTLFVAAGANFIYRHISISLEESLFSLFHTLGAVSMLYQCVAIVVLRHELAAIFDGLSKIYNESEENLHF